MAQVMLYKRVDNKLGDTKTVLKLCALSGKVFVHIGQTRYR